MKLKIKLSSIAVLSVGIAIIAWAEPEAPKVTETSKTIEIELPAEPTATIAAPKAGFDPLVYTLGPDDAVEISVMRHPEFSGVYPINKEGKLQYKFVGDLDVNGLTKAQLEQKIREALSVYVNSPEVNVTITDYRSKVIYIIGEVAAPGKYYMQSEAITVREAVFQAGLPTASAAMRKCRLITPRVKGNAIVKSVDLYAVLYAGKLRKNINMHPGDVLYVPSTVMAKVIRVINPVASTVGLASQTTTGAGDTRRSANTVQGRAATY